MPLLISAHVINTHIITSPLCLHKDQYQPAVHLLAQQPDELWVLVFVRNELHNLGDVVVGFQVWTTDDHLCKHQDSNAGLGYR